MGRVTHIWPCLVVDADGPKNNKSYVDSQRKEWVEEFENGQDCFAQKYEDREYSNYNVEVRGTVSI